MIIEVEGVLLNATDGDRMSLWKFGFLEPLTRLSARQNYTQSNLK
jgi:hypothetical protein